MSIAQAFKDIAQSKRFVVNDLIEHNELFHSLQHHSAFSNSNSDKTLEQINTSLEEHKAHLLHADWCFITFGSAWAWQYEHGQIVANNHKLPNDSFEKVLLDIEDMFVQMTEALNSIRTLNASLQFVFTVSPVRHMRNGLIADKRSKARLIELAHKLSAQFGGHYFPSYELQIDVLRDYRFYAEDLLHPNEQAIHFIWEQLRQTAFEPKEADLLRQIQQINNDLGHRPLHIEKQANKLFFEKIKENISKLELDYPYLSFKDEREALFN